jgi:hypothetical protein
VNQFEIGDKVRMVKRDGSSNPTGIIGIVQGKSFDPHSFLVQFPDGKWMFSAEELEVVDPVKPTAPDARYTFRMTTITPQMTLDEFLAYGATTICFFPDVGEERSLYWDGKFCVEIGRKEHWYDTLDEALRVLMGGQC